MAKSKFYVVWQGKQTGIFTDWETCRQQVSNVKGAKYKSYPTKTAAQAAFAAGPSAALAAGRANGTSESNSRSSSTAASGKTTSASRSNSVKTYTAAEIEQLPSDTFIYTDGGCEPNPGEAGSGMAIYRDGKIDELWYGLYNPNGTNNTAELNALHQALIIAEHEINNNRSVTILCDSKYSIQCITQWAVNWEKKGWTKSGGEIKNLDIIKPMFALYQSIKGKVSILHVNGHVGVEGNELADRMSIYAMEKQDTDFCKYPKVINIEKILALRTG